MNEIRHVGDKVSRTQFVFTVDPDCASDQVFVF